MTDTVAARWQGEFFGMSDWKRYTARTFGITWQRDFFDWVQPDAVFFLTVNCQQRGVPQFTLGDLAAKLFVSISHYHHLIRNEADHEDKWSYIRENPVRKGLVETFDQWPHVWFPDRIGWQ
jgi:hypothetical protein